MGGRRAQRLHRCLVVAEVALAVVLVTAAGLMLRSLAGLMPVDPGFVTGHLLTFEVNLPPLRRGNDPRGAAFYRDLFARLRSLPGVQSAAAASRVPLAGPYAEMGLYLEGGGAVPRGTAGRNLGTAGHVFTWLASPGYFQTLRLPVVRGRGIEERDAAEAPLVAVVNETLARRSWPRGDAVGKRIQLGTTGSGRGPLLEVVGVVRDVPMQRLDERAEPQAYLPQAQGVRITGDQARAMTIVVRTVGDPLALAAAVRREVRAANPAVPVANLESADEMLQQTVAPTRFILALLGTFAVLALALAAAGIYGVQANAVRRREHELAVRRAVGAGPGDLVWLVVREGMLLALLGSALGLSLAAGVTRFEASLLFGVRPIDAPTFAAAAVLFGAVGLLACLIPARRTLVSDPVSALRSQ